MSLNPLAAPALRPRRAGEPRAPASSRSLGFASFATVALGALAFVVSINLRPSLHVEGSGARALVICFLLTALHVRPRRNIATRSNMETINLDEVLFVPIVVMLQPWHSIAVVVIASLIGSVAVRRSIVKSAFNIGQLALAASVGVAVVAALGVSPSDAPTHGAVLAGMAGGLAMTGVTALVVRAMVAFATGLRVRPLLRDIVHSFAPWTGAVTLGAVGVIAVVAWAPAAVLVAGVVLFVHRAYAAGFREVTARRLAERLQQAVASLRSDTDPAMIRAHVAAAASDLLGAGRAAVIDGDDSPEVNELSAPLGPGLQLAVSDRLGPGTWVESDRMTLETLAGVAGDVLRSAEALERLRIITDSQREGVIALDPTGLITFANPAARAMMREPRDGILDGNVDSRMTLRDHRRPLDIAEMVAQRQFTHDADATLDSEGHASLEVAYSLTPLRAAGERVGAVLVLRDVTERRALERALQHRELHDDLTGLPNRRLLLDRLKHALDRSEVSGAKHGLLFIDLDRFKLVNESYGHASGDKLLVAVATRLRASLPTEVSLARLSGGEFVVLVEDVSGLEEVTDVADHILSRLRESYVLERHPMYMSASIGVVLTDGGQGHDEALAAAGAAAYAAKTAGRDCYRVSTTNSFRVARSRLDLEARLRQGVENGDFFMVYQPIVKPDTLEVVGVEALVRWNSDGRGVVEPVHFIPLAEETGLILPLGRWILEESCRRAQEWTLQHPERRPLSVSVNLSALQFSQAGLVEQVSQTLADSGLAASQLCLEITESVLMTDTPSTIQTLDSLRELGIRVAIDDFGTGYSALSYLKRFPIDVVKLDRSFVRGLDIDVADTEIVSAVVRLSAALGIQTVAEGVEEEVQRRLLEDMGCSLIQGYLVARPLMPAAFVEFWQTHADTARRTRIDRETPHDAVA